MLTMRTLALVSVLLASVVLLGNSQRGDQLNGLRCELQRGEGDTLDASSGSHFHFLLLSDKDGLQVFAKTNMWGYFARSFTIDAESKHYEIKRRDVGWDKNWPEPVTINRGGVLVTNVFLCDGSWRVSPKLPVRDRYFAIVGHYSLRPEDDPPKDAVMTPINNLWHGTITSAPLELALTEGCIRRLNSTINDGGSR